MQAINNTAHDITLKGRTALGTLELVRSITPAEVRQREILTKQNIQTTETVEDKNQNSARINMIDNFVEELIPNVSLGELTEEQRQKAKRMLYEERNVFCVDKEE